MSERLLETIESALSGIVQETPAPPDQASVLVQFAAGDWAKIRQAVKDAREQLGPKEKHDIADAAGVVSHSSGGQPFTADQRLDAAIDAMPDPVPVDAPVEAAPAADSQGATP